MGLQSGGKCIYKSKPISLGDLYKVLEDRRDSRLTTNDTSKRKPSLDIDANNVGFFSYLKLLALWDHYFKLL